MHSVRTEVSSPSSCTPSHTGHTVLSGVCDALCFSSLIGFHECIWSLGEIQDVLYNFTDLPPGCSHSKCQPFSVSTQPAFLQQPANMTSGPDVEPTLDLPRA